MIHSYARVSTDGQSIAAQAKQLRAAVLRRVADDVLLVTRLDRHRRATFSTSSAMADKRARSARERMEEVRDADFLPHRCSNTTSI
jgi:hypothetical protein